MYKQGYFKSYRRIHTQRLIVNILSGRIVKNFPLFNLRYFYKEKNFVYILITNDTIT